MRRLGVLGGSSAGRESLFEESCHCAEWLSSPWGGATCPLPQTSLGGGF